MYIRIIIITGIILLLIRYALFVFYKPQLHDGERVRLETTVLSEPTKSARFNRLPAEYCNGFGCERVLVTYPPTIRISYGDHVSIIGTIEETVLGRSKVVTMYMPNIEIKNQNPKGKNENNSSVISMSLGLKSHGLSGSEGSSKQKMVEDSSSSTQNDTMGDSGLLSVGRMTMLNLAGGLRSRIQELYFENLSKQDANLLMGIVLGIKGSFTKSFSQDLQSTGVLHVIAASGMNVTMVGGFLFGLALKLFNRRNALLFTILGVTFYAVVSGLQPSIVRATLMGVMAFGAQLLGRQYAGMYGLGLAGWLMLMWSPSLIRDVGFQLSIMSTVGILFIKPLFPQAKAFDDIGTTISAQIMTLPILLGNFGTYGILSILVNALVLWTIPPLMVLGGVGGLIGLELEPVGSLLIIFCQPFLWIFEHVVSYFGSLHWNVQVSNFPAAMIVGYYLIVSAFLFYKTRPQAN